MGGLTVLRDLRPVAFGLVVAIACAPPPPAAETPGPTAGWIRYVAKQKQTQSVVGVTKTVPTLQISVPPEWTIASETSDLFTRLQQAYAADGDYTVRFVAVGPTQETSGDPAYAIISSWPLEGIYTPEDIGAATFGNYFDSSRALMVEARTVEIGQRRARRQELRFDDTLATGRRITRWVTQYFIVRGRDAFMLEFTADWDGRASFVDTFDAIAGTFALPDHAP